MADRRKFNDYNYVVELLAEAQKIDFDMREACREADHFVNKRDGQWEPEILSRMTNRPRYTFDKCTSIVDQISGELAQAEFAIKCKPAGDGATNALAKTHDGLLRNIQNVSKASDIYIDSAQRTLECGLSGWRVDHDWFDDDSFYQDLFIREIPNYIDRVWLDPNHEKPDASDARWGFVLDPMEPDDYYTEFPNGGGESVSETLTSNVYWYKKEAIVIAEFWYRKQTNRTLGLLSNGAIVEIDEKFETIRDELEQQGITVQQERKSKKSRFWVRKFDGTKWLTKAKETVFSTIPIIPLYGNFKVSENKIVYQGVVEKLMDSQRVYNYARSRQIEEGALAPRAKYWMTKEQAKGHGNKLSTLNTNADPVQFYNHIDGVPPPVQQGGAQINQGLQQTAQDASADLNEIAGLFSANMGQDPNYMQTGAAIERLQNKGDSSTYKWFRSLERAIARTGDIIVRAVPLVYDQERIVRIVGPDDVEEDVLINQKIIDQQTGRPVIVYDLSRGKYDLTCSAGPAFQNRQDQVVKTVTTLAQVDKSILDIGADILLKNMNAPGMDEIAARKRIQMLLADMIPVSQQTDEEKEALRMVKEAQAKEPPSPMDQALIAQAQAETQKAEATALKAETAATDMLNKIEERNAKMDLERKKFREQQAQNQRNTEIQMAKLANDIQKIQGDIQTNVAQMVIDSQNAVFDQLKTQAETLNLLRSAIGAEAIVSPQAVGAYQGQAELIGGSIDDAD